MRLAELTTSNIVSADTYAATALIDNPIDLSQYEGDVRVTLQANNQAGTDPTLDVACHGSSDDGVADAYAAITGGGFTQVTDAAASTQTIVLDTRAIERYLQVKLTIGGTDSPAFEVAVSITGRKKYRS